MIRSIDIFRLSIPMHPFTIATGTMQYAQNTLIRIHTSSGETGLGECSAFPMIVGETQATCFEMAKDFAAIWKGKEEDDIEVRMNELHLYTAFNSTIKSAFDMALFDLKARKNGVPLYKLLGGSRKTMETDLTIGISDPEDMARQAVDFISRGVRILKVKLGKDPQTDIERIRKIREAVGKGIVIRIDANQGWSYEHARYCLQELGVYDIEFCEQPMKFQDDEQLPLLRKYSPVPIMADESVYDHYDAERLIRSMACDSVNIKFAKSGGILEALKIHDTCKNASIPCMMGGMLESRLALTAFAHFAMACPNIHYYDMDTCMLGHRTDPVTGGVIFNGFQLEVPEEPGIGAGMDDGFLAGCESISI